MNKKPTNNYKDYKLQVKKILQRKYKESRSIEKTNRNKSDNSKIREENENGTFFVFRRFIRNTYI